MKTLLIKNNKIDKITDDFVYKSEYNADEILYLMSEVEFEERCSALGFNNRDPKSDNTIDINKIETYQNFTYIEMNAVINKQLPMWFYINSDTLVIIIKADQASKIKGIIDEITFNMSIAKTVYVLMNARFKESYKDITNLENELAELEECLIKQDDKEPGYVKEIIRQRKRLSTHQKDYDQLALVIDDIYENENQIFKQNELIYFQNLDKSIQRINSNIKYQMDYLSQIREAYEYFTDIKLNHIIKILTVLTAVFLPLTLIVGWFGMNFKTMPEFSWEYGYAYVIALSITTLGICLYIFKKKGWI